MADLDFVYPRHAEDVIPSDSTVVSFTELYIGSSGDVAVMLADDSVAVTLKSITAGTRLYGQIIRVMSTNTNAINIVGFKPANPT